MTHSSQAHPPQGRQVRIRYRGEWIAAQPGQRLLDVLLRHNPDHRHICGGRGFCTSCRVEVLRDPQGLTPPSALERNRLGREAGRLRLACQAVIRGQVEVRVPEIGASRYSPFGEDER